MMPKTARITVSVGSSLPANGFNVSHEEEKIFVNGMFADRILLAMKGSQGTVQVDIGYDLNYANKRHLSLYRAVSVDIVKVVTKSKAPPSEPVEVVAILPHQQRVARPRDYLTGRVESTLEGVIFTGSVATHIVALLGRPGGYHLKAVLRPYRGYIRGIDWEIASMHQIFEELGRVHVSSERKGPGKLLK